MPCRQTYQLTLVRCRGVRRMHLRTNVPARVRAPGSQFGSSAHGSLLRAKKEFSKTELLRAGKET